MLLNIAIGCGLVVVTTFVHATAMVLSIRCLKLVQVRLVDRRLLASLQAANGIIMFGWTMAFIVAVLHRIYGANPDDDGPGVTTARR